jgi:glycerate 2-kinase
MDHRQNAIDIFLHAVAAVNPFTLVRSRLGWKPPYLQINGGPVLVKPSSRVFIIGAGKASALMAQAAEETLGDVLAGGIIVTKREHGLPLNRLICIEAGHPVPDAASLQATEAVLTLVKNLNPDDIVLLLLSGGASSLLADCPGDTTLAEVQEVFDLLLKSGAPIQEMNAVRKHLSGVKGGQLARYIYPARLYALILSDVPGDHLDVIGSGVTAPDSSTFHDALAVLNRYQIADKIPDSVYRYLLNGCEGKMAETPKVGDACFTHTHNSIIGSNKLALEAAAQKAGELGYRAHIVTDQLKGEARVLGQMLAAEAIAYNGGRPACLLYGGESTVTVKGRGMGGRNMELALAAGIGILDHPGITILSAGTDGTDGPTDAAGAVVDAVVMEKAMAHQHNPAHYLQNNDSYHFFSRAGALIKTGPTQTNVMDIVLALIH